VISFHFIVPVSIDKNSIVGDSCTISFCQKSARQIYYHYRWRQRGNGKNGNRQCGNASATVTSKKKTRSRIMEKFIREPVLVERVG